jgi:NADH-quinone oxidoreductase subunit N
MNLFLNDWVGLIPEVYFGFVFLIFFCFGVEKKESFELGIQGQLIGIWLFFLVLGNWYVLKKTEWFSLFLNNFFLDDWSFFWKIFLIFLVFFYFSFLKKVSFEYMALILLFHFAVFVLLSSSNLLLFYLSLELSSFILYLLVGSQRESLSSTEAGLKYFVLGSFASILLLVGILFSYQITGSLSLLDLRLWGEGQMSISYVIGILFIFFGLFFKLGAAPFHFWIPDVYHGSSWSVLYWLVVVSKVGVLGFFLRFLYTVAMNQFDLFSLSLSFVGILSVLIGTLGAVQQTNLKRLVGYSGISHMGFMVLGMGSGTGLGLLSVVNYFFVYVTLNGLWILLMWLKETEWLFELKKMISWFAGFFLLTMFSLVGVPPLSGFFMKFYLLIGFVQIKNFVIALFLVLFSVLSAFYYLRLVRMISFEKEEGVRVEFSSLSVSSTWYLIGLGYLTVFFACLQTYGFGWV